MPPILIYELVELLTRKKMLKTTLHFVDCLYVGRQLCLQSKQRLDYETLESKH